MNKHMDPKYAWLMLMGLYETIIINDMFGCGISIPNVYSSDTDGEAAFLEIVRGDIYKGEIDYD